MQNMSVSVVTYVGVSATVGFILLGNVALSRLDNRAAQGVKGRFWALSDWHANWRIPAAVRAVRFRADLLAIGTHVDIAELGACLRGVHRVRGSLLLADAMHEATSNRISCWAFHLTSWTVCRADSGAFVIQ